jgi:hypothetical protein
MRRTNTSFLALLIVLTTSHAAYSQTKILEPEKVIEQTIAAGESHSYSMTLAAGMFGHIELSQKELNLTLTVFSIDGQKLRTADLASVGFSEEMSLIAQDATTYRIEVKAAARSSHSGSYTLKLTKIHPATAEDRARVQGQTLAEDGMQFLIKQSANSKLSINFKNQFRSGTRQKIRITKHRHFITSLTPRIFWANMRRLQKPRGKAVPWRSRPVTATSKPTYSTNLAVLSTIAVNANRRSTYFWRRSNYGLMPIQSGGR